MASTPNYNFTLPTIGGDQNSWGNELNSNWSSLDTLLHNAASSTGQFLPLTGGAISGSLSVAGALQTNGSFGVSGAASFGYPSVNDFQIYRASPNRVLSWASGVTDVYNESNASRFWNVHSGSMSLDGSGNLTITGGGFKPGGGSWTATSDDRVKRNVTNYDTGLARVCALHPIAFEYNGEGGTVDDGIRYIGLSAQHTKPIMPELVSEMPNGYLAIEQGPLSLAVVNAIRELADRVGALEDAA